MIVRASRSRSNRRGMTLLEVLIAMAVFLFSLVAIAELMNIANSTAFETQQRNVCARLAQSKMAEYVSGVSSATASGTGTFEDQGEPDWKWTSESTSQSAANLRSVTIKVSREFPGDRPIELSLTQYIFDPAARGSPADSETVPAATATPTPAVATPTPAAATPTPTPSTSTLKAGK